ncbi:hypothetical protein [Actinophytocola sp.]|uniref:hypothetical protein n=1 Tax=Actinophytocola sp. TaxID=1872138 RepID=UPI002ED3F417
MNDPLSKAQIAALFALMGAGREISNNELSELVGFRIDGKTRTTLNERHLVTSTQASRSKPYLHTLTDAGWKRCEAELTGGLLSGTKEVAGAFYLVLDGLARYLQRDNKALAQLFRAATEAPADLDEQITSAYRQLAEKQGDYVPLAQLRQRLNGADRSEVDRVLKEMSKTKRAELTPHPDRRALTDADRAAAIRIGGEDNHLLVVERS